MMPFLKWKHEIPRSRRLEKKSSKEGTRHAIITPSHDTYVGEWKKSKKDGYGSMVTRSWRLYEGDWMKDYRHNIGTSAQRNDEKVYIIEYRGNWKYGHYNGFGEKHYADESYYKGHMKNSKRHGYGQMWYADGSFYDGDWIRDSREGLGMFVNFDGNRYEGSWKGDAKHGKGRYFHLNSGQMQQGAWIWDVCVTSFVEDIPFRQTSTEPSNYCIQVNELENWDKVYKIQEDMALRNGQIMSKISSSWSITEFKKGD